MNNPINFAETTMQNAMTQIRSYNVTIKLMHEACLNNRKNGNDAGAEEWIVKSRAMNMELDAIWDIYYNAEAIAEKLVIANKAEAAYQALKD